MLADAVGTAARRVGAGQPEGRRHSLGEMRQQMKEMEERARRRQQQQSDGREGVASGEMVSYLASSVQPVLAQALLELDQEQPRPAEVAAALQRVVRGPEELRSAPPASILQSESPLPPYEPPKPQPKLQPEPPEPPEEGDSL